MEKEQIEILLSKIKEIEVHNLELDEILSKIEISNRDEILEEIMTDIMRHNKLFQDLEISQEIIAKDKVSEPETMQMIVENMIANIKKMPNKKIIFLRLFLERFYEISEQDKNVILQSLKDYDHNEIKEKIGPLIKTFKLKL